MTSKETKLIEYNSNLYCPECLSLIKMPINYGCLKEEFENAIIKIKRNKEKVVFALSGGKDSIVALQILVEKYGIRPITFTIDHGFKNDTIMKNCINIVSKYNLPWYLTRVEPFVIQRLKILATSGELPCIECNRLWKDSHFIKISNLFFANYLFTGGDTPVNGKALYYKETIPNVTIGLPLVVERFSEATIYQKAYRLDWINPNLEGLDTDCIAVGIALEKYREKTKAQYHVEEKKHLSQKIRFGLIDKKSAKERLLIHNKVNEKEVSLFENI